MDIRFQTDDWRRFVMAECCTTVYDRGNYYVGRSFERIARRGVSQPRHMSVGRFRKEDTGYITTETPCYLPYTFIEAEEGDLIENFHATKLCLEILHAEGYDVRRMHLRYSGNQSLWISIPSAMMGHPIGSVADQKALRKRLFVDLLDCRLDEHLWDGRHLHRLVGSVHEKGSHVQVVPFGALRSLETFSEAIRRNEFREPLPLEGPCPELLGRAKAKTEFHVPAMDRVVRDRQGHGFMEETAGGVEEGNRNYTAFRRACVLIKRHDETEARSRLDAWNAKCSPPLPDRELTSCFESARRTVSQKT